MSALCKITFRSDRPSAWSLIFALLLPCGPTAVSREVPLGIVNSVQSLSGVPNAHVGKKVFEFIPSLADRNLSVNIGTDPVLRGSRFAPQTHALPRGVGRGSGHAVRPPGHPTARFYPSRRDVIKTLHAFVAAITTTKGISFPIFFYPLNHKKMRVFLANKRINLLGASPAHGDLTTLFRENLQAETGPRWDVL